MSTSDKYSEDFDTADEARLDMADWLEKHSNKCDRDGSVALPIPANYREAARLLRECSIPSAERPAEAPASQFSVLDRDAIVTLVESYFHRVRKLGGDTGECDAHGIADWLMWDGKAFLPKVSVASSASPSIPEGWKLVRDGGTIWVSGPEFTDCGVNHTGRGDAADMLWGLADALLEVAPASASGQAEREELERLRSEPYSWARENATQKADAARFQWLCDAAGREWEALFGAQMTGRLREEIDARMAATEGGSAT